MITDAQAETILAIRSAGYGYVGFTFYPHDIFPTRNNADNGHRRTLRKLHENGLLDDGDDFGQLRIIQKTLDAYSEWYTKRGFRFD